MPQALLERMSAELPPINRALDEACAALPKPAQPVARHILNAGGKRLRPFLVVCCARLLGHAGSDVYSLAGTMEMLHTATLLHDDVLDNARTRRGQAAAHVLFNPASVILAGDALLAGANAIVAGYGKPALTQCFSNATSQTAAGEILEISCIGRVNLGEEEYLEIIRGKTACLLGEACRLGALHAGAAPSWAQALYDFGLNLGVAFQMVDDALDFAPAEQTGKPTGGDALEGKLTPPLRLYRQSLPQEARAAFDHDFSNGLIGPQKAEELARVIREKGFDAQTRILAESYLAKARHALSPLPNGNEKDILLLMLEYIANRKK